MAQTFTRVSQQAARYTLMGGIERCGRCRFFLKNNLCARVVGDVSPSAWCKFFSMAARAVNMDAGGGAAATHAGSGGPPGVTLDLSFTTGTLDPRITFTRASIGTYFDVAGVLQTAGVNLVTNSGPLTNFVPAASSMTAAAAVAPDGTTTGMRLTESAAATIEHNTDFAFTPTANAVYTASAFVQPNTRTRVDIAFRVAGNWVGGNAIAVANLSAGTIAVTSGTATAAIQPAGSGWYRISITATAVAAPAGQSTFRVGLCDNTGNPVYTGDGVSNAYFWGAQLEIGSSASAYIPTTTAANGAPRFDYDPVTHAARGLLIEEQRTNSVRNGNATGSVNGTPGTLPTNWLYTNSGGGVVAISVVSSGVENGISYVDIRLTGTPTGAAIAVAMETGNGIAASAGQVWVHSSYVRLIAGSMSNITTVNLGMAPLDAAQTSLVQTGVSFVATTPTGAALSSQRYSTPAWTVAVSSGTVAAIRPTVGINLVSTGVPIDITLRIGGAQIELGAFPTSYIPTTAAAVTRAVEAASLSAATWVNATAGTMYVESQLPISPVEAAGHREFLSLGADTSNIVELRGTAATNTLATTVFTANTLRGSATEARTWAANVPFKAAVSYGATTVRISSGGSVPTSGALSAVPTFTTMWIGGGTRFPVASSWYRRVTYWPRELSNSELQQVTT